MSLECDDAPPTPVDDQRFPSLDAAKYEINEYAKHNGFSISILRSEKKTLPYRGMFSKTYSVMLLYCPLQAKMIEINHIF